ncbi:MAG TPA: DUF4190 domain-containing protein, partial [Polyangia bacterium]
TGGFTMTTQPEATTFRPATLTLAIFSLVLCILGLFPPILPLVGPIAAVVTGTIARKEILAHPELYSGEGMARAGIILGWIGIGLALLACLAMVLGFFFFSIHSSTSTIGIPSVITVQP